MSALGIEDIGVYIPATRTNNHRKMAKFGFEQHFLDEKIGVYRTSVKDDEEECSDMCVKAWNALQEKTPFDPDDIDVIIVATQNSDIRMPHGAAYVHGKLGLKPGCASFDVSLGCSGFVYGLSAITSFMKQNEMKKGVLFTADPYSKVVDPEERNTSLLFGDAATATLITENAELIPGRFTFGTLGEKADEIRLVDEKLSMNGLAVVKFVKKYIPADIRKNIELNGLTMNDVDKFLLHQASRHMVRTVMKDLGIDEARVPFEIRDYGNTISSSIPILLEKEILQTDVRNYLTSGFGIGFSWASCVLRRV